MNAEDNKALVRCFWLGMFSGRNLEMADELFAPDHVMHNPYLRKRDAVPTP